MGSGLVLPARTVLENEDLLRLIGSYLRSKLPFILTHKVVKAALRPIDYNPKIKWIISFKKDFFNSQAMIEFAQYMNCEINLIKPNQNLCYYAACTGSIDVLQWARSTFLGKQVRCATNENTLSGAIKHDKLETARYLRSLSPPCSWNENSCAVAAYYGRLNILQWLRDPNPSKGKHCCPWDARTCANAADGGHLDLLQWARAQEPPCPWSEETCFNAAKHGNLEMLKWLKFLTPPCPWVKEDCLRIAELKGFLAMVAWIDLQSE